MYAKKYRPNKRYNNHIGADRAIDYCIKNKTLQGFAEIVCPPRVTKTAYRDQDETKTATSASKQSARAAQKASGAAYYSSQYMADCNTQPAQPRRGQHGWAKQFSDEGDDDDDDDESSANVATLLCSPANQAARARPGAIFTTDDDDRGCGNDDDNQLEADGAVATGTESPLRGNARGRPRGRVHGRGVARGRGRARGRSRGRGGAAATAASGRGRGRGRGRKAGAKLSAIAARKAAGKTARRKVLLSSDPAEIAAGAKPDFTYIQICALAIFDLGDECAVRDIYAWVQDRYPWFGSGPKYWRNSFRHQVPCPWFASPVFAVLNIVQCVCVCVWTVRVDLTRLCGRLFDRLCDRLCDPWYQLSACDWFVKDDVAGQYAFHRPVG